MRKRSEPILKIACLILAAWVLYQLIGVGWRINPLHGVTVPALPTLAASTNNSPTLIDNNNHLLNPASTAVTIKATNNTALLTGTNLVKTNAISLVSNTNGSATNAVTNTNSIAPEKIAKVETNPPTPLVVIPSDTNLAAKKIPAPTGTNAALTAMGTNAVSHSNSVAKVTSQTSASTRRPSMGRGGMGGRTDNLPPVVQAQVAKIIDSEILGAVPHPLPMALFGIAGEVAFLRSPDGQSGMVKEGDSLGEIKLVRIGINRVLVEQDGQQKELMIFDGHGSESLLDKQGGTNNEIH